MLTIFTQKYREECIKSCEPLLLDWLVRLLSNSSALELNLWPCSQNTPALDRNSNATGLLSSPRWSICLHLLFPWGDQPLGYKGLEVKASHYLYSHCMFPPAVTVSLVLLTSFPCLPHETWFTVRNWRFTNWRWRIPGNEATSPYSVLSLLLPRIMSAIHIISGASKLGLTIWVHTNCARKQQQSTTIIIRLETATVTWGGVVTYLCLKMISKPVFSSIVRM